MSFVNSKYKNPHNPLCSSITKFSLSKGIMNEKPFILGTLVYRIDVHARLLILSKKSPLHGLILVCTFIDFEKKFPLHVYSILHVYWYWYVQNFTLLMIQNKVFQSIAKAILMFSKVSQSIHTLIPINVQDGIEVQGGTFSQNQ